MKSSSTREVSQVKLAFWKMKAMGIVPFPFNFYGTPAAQEIVNLTKSDNCFTDRLLIISLVNLLISPLPLFLLLMIHFMIIKCWV